MNQELIVSRIIVTALSTATALAGLSSQPVLCDGKELHWIRCGRHPLGRWNREDRHTGAGEGEIHDKQNDADGISRLAWVRGLCLRAADLRSQL